MPLRIRGMVVSLERSQNKPEQLSSDAYKSAVEKEKERDFRDFFLKSLLRKGEKTLKNSIRYRYRVFVPAIEPEKKTTSQWLRLQRLSQRKRQSEWIYLREPRQAHGCLNGLSGSSGDWQIRQMSTASFLMCDTSVGTATPEPTSLSSAGEISIAGKKKPSIVLYCISLFSLYLSILSVSLPHFTLAANKIIAAAKKKREVFINDFF